MDKVNEKIWNLSDDQIKKIGKEAITFLFENNNPAVIKDCCFQLLMLCAENNNGAFDKEQTIINELWFFADSVQTILKEKEKCVEALN
jgi:hypothetical protein